MQIFLKTMTFFPGDFFRMSYVIFKIKNILKAIFEKYSKCQKTMPYIKQRRNNDWTFLQILFR